MLSMMVEGSTDNPPQTDTTSVLHLEMKTKTAHDGHFNKVETLQDDNNNSNNSSVN